MAIVRMKHLRLIALTKDRDALIHDLARMGVVEVSTPPEDEWSERLKPSLSDTARLFAERGEVVGAVNILSQHVKIKRGMFAEKKPISEKVFFSDEAIEGALNTARTINSHAREIAACFSNEGRLVSRRDALVPWKNIDIPLDEHTKGRHFLAFGTVASKFILDAIKETIAQDVPDAYLECASSDKEQHYLLFICYREDEEKLIAALRPFGFSKTQFKDISGTAAENIASIENELAQSVKKRAQLVAEIAKKAEDLPKLDVAYDALSARIERAEAQENLRETAHTVLLTGWFPERETARLTKLFDSYGAAYEIRDPNDDEQPPTLTYNSRMVAPFEMITNMYSPPSYREVDPNPLMAPFFAVLFGIMFSDAAYGILLTLVGAIVLRKFKPRGGVKQMMSMAVMCGITTFIWGVLFGGFFGDAIPTVYKMITGNEFTWKLALWFNPLDDPMLMLIFSFALGGIHIFAGMAIQAYIMIRDGRLLDAIFDIGSWWVLFGGIIFALLGVMNVGLVLIAIGALALLLTQGRNEKKIFKKITSGLASLYNITSYLGDILSYSRLLALSLATAVIASVINTMGAMTGPIGFVIVFLIGHTFNIAVNLIGTYVHTSRLQYVEFFGKFYQGGGELFSPLDTKTKYVDIIKEEK